MKLSLARFGFFLIACVAIIWFWRTVLENNPYHAEVIKFVSTDPQVEAQLGPVTSATMARITSVGSSIDYDDKFTPAYDIFQVEVHGKRRAAVVTIERKDGPEAAGSIMRVTSID